MAMAEPEAAAAAAAAAPCSVSQPLFASREFKEGDPLRALTTSVSFGRFMTEPLDWERWSSFSHNRIREDVQKHSRPGAVAEKKAFFEAYFNRFSSKKSAKPTKKENRPPNYSPQIHVSPVTKSNTLENQSPTVATDENMGNRGAESERTPNQGCSSPSIKLVFSEKRNVDDIISSSGQMEQGKTSSGHVTSPIVSSNRGVEREISNEDACSPLINLAFPEIGNVDEKPSASLVCSQFGNAEENVSSNKAPKKDACLSTTNLVFSEVGNVDDIISIGGQMEQEKASTENVSSKNKCSPLTNLVCPDIGNVDEKPSTNLVCSQFGNVEENVWSNKGPKKDVCSSTTNLVFSDVGNVDDIISSGGQMEQKRTSTKNVSSENRSQVKISDQSSRVDRNKKRQIKDKISGQTKTGISSVKSSSRKPPIPEIHPKNQILKHNPRVPSFNAVKKNTQALPISENKRYKPLLDCLVNGNKTVVLKSHSTIHPEALFASTKKPRSITVPSAFSFKSDERAAKRKQFFQKLEEKPKLKEKTRSDDKRLRWSTALEAKPSTRDTRGPINKIQKVQPTQTCPQKLGTKPKNFIEINKKMLSSSMACFPSKKSHD